MSSNKEKAKTIELAEKHVKKGKLREAIAEYNKLLDGSAQDIHIRNIIGDLYLKSNQKSKGAEEFLNIAKYYDERGLSSQSIAVYKKISKLKPGDTEIAEKLADLYYDQGFLNEAKVEYLKAAESLRKDNRTDEVISLFEKILKLDKEDVQIKLTLAELYAAKGLKDQAIKELNDVAELKIRNDDLKEAKELLNQAKKLERDDFRTLTNLINLLKKENKKKEALSLIDDILKKDGKNIQALKLLGNLYYEDRNLKKAQEIFSKLISLRSKDVESRVKLGRIHIHQGSLDQAFKLYGPLVDTLIRRQRTEKAIGLLGLILSTPKIHIPSVEKLAAIYKSKNQRKNLEVAYNLILEEYEKKNLKEKSFPFVEELAHLFPQNEVYGAEYKKLCKELGKEEIAPAKPIPILDEEKEIIETNLSKAELYIEQGLIRNAKRILENLKLRYPEDPRIEEKLENLTEISPGVREEDIPDRVEKVTERESHLFGKDLVSESSKIPSFVKDEQEEDKLTAADIFADTDIIPMVPQEFGEKKYYELNERIVGELEAIKAMYSQQLKGDTTIVEKELSDIVTEFRRVVEEKVDKEAYDSRFNLGIAFMEQGLIEEAIEEFKLASVDKTRTVECYSVISDCYRQKENLKEALKWAEKALEVSPEGTHEFWALKFELASLNEGLKNKKKALDLYNEVKKWNAEFRDVVERVKKLEKDSQK